MVSFMSAGMLYNLIEACGQDKLPSCRNKDVYSNCRTSLSGGCKDLDLQVPLRLIRTFFLVKLGKYQTQLDHHNREIGLKVASCFFKNCTKPD